MTDLYRGANDFLLILLFCHHVTCYAANCAIRAFFQQREILLAASLDGVGPSEMDRSSPVTVYGIVVCFVVIWIALRKMQKQEEESVGLMLNDVRSRLGTATAGVGRVVVWPLVGP